MASKRRRHHPAAPTRLQPNRSCKVRRDQVAEFNLLCIPDDVLRDILLFAAPRGHLVPWKWRSQASLTCKTFRRFLIEDSPQSLDLEASLFGRVPLTKAFRDVSWMGERLLELHVGWSSMLLAHDCRPNFDMIASLRSLLTSRGALPNLTWLDITAMSDHSWHDLPVADRTFFSNMPAALPRLSKLCLAGCFGEEKITAPELLQFLESLQSPLESLSLGQIGWMTDDHVAQLVSSVGHGLTRLELMECDDFVFDEDGELADAISLSDASLEAIARSCRNLQSFSFTSGDGITALGLCAVLRANRSLRHLDLSSTMSRDVNFGRDVIAFIGNEALELRSFRAYFCGWLDDHTLSALVEAQVQHCKGSGISLQTLGIYLTGATLDGVRHALEKGRGVLGESGGRIEITWDRANLLSGDESDMHFYGHGDKPQWRDFVIAFPDVNFVEHSYPVFVDGSIAN